MASNSDIKEKMENLHVEENSVVVNGEEDGEDIVNPWDVVSKSAKGVDYDKLISKGK